VRSTVPPSAEIEARIDRLLAVGVGENPRESLSELAKLGARLIIQRAVEDEFEAWLGRARYERRPEYQRGLRNYEGGLRNGFRPRRVQTAEGELSVEIPQVREAAETFASKLFPRGTKLVRTEPHKALVVGAFVRGLSMRDVESLCEKAGLGKFSKSTASRVCEELRERYEAFKRRDLYGVHLDGHSSDALVATDPMTGDIVGVGRVAALPDKEGAVDVAVTVGEPWQGRGLGTALLARLIEQARDEGHHAVHATVLAENTASIAMLRRAGFASRSGAGAMRAFELAFTEPRGRENP
jgi:RimJ/RimL family protein N-acetyltransferase